MTWSKSFKAIIRSTYTVCTRPSSEHVTPLQIQTGKFEFQPLIPLAVENSSQLLMLSRSSRRTETARSEIGCFGRPDFGRQLPSHMFATTGCMQV